MCSLLLLMLFLPLAVVGQEAAAPPPPPAPPSPPPDPSAMKQVRVSVKIIEFQTTKGVETGLSAYFAQRNKVRAFGRISSGNGNIRSADITFPSATNSGITVFLDQIHLNDGDLEMVLQALVDQNRAFILSQPQAIVKVAEAKPTVIKTTQNIPYENTVVVGSTATQVTSFHDTGVTLQVSAPEVLDDDGNLETNEDTYIKLLVSAAVNEEGERIVVALSNQAAARPLSDGNNAIRVPEFISRRVATSAWVRHGQVLLLGGLFRNTKNKNLSTLPWLTQGEDLAMGVAQRFIPGASALGSPLSATLGNRSTSDGRRELVFLIKAELWRRQYTVATQFGEEVGKVEEKKKGLIQGISEIPQGIAEGIRGGQDTTDVDSNLGGGN